MNCPQCGTEVSSGVKYCPTCGSDIEATLQRSAGQARPIDATRRMPPLQDQTSPRPSQKRGAVPMNSSMPQQQNLRSFDTKQMSSTPKWPIVLIVLLLLVIVVAVALIIFRPWEAPSPQGPSDGGTQVSVSSAADQGGTTGTDQAADATGETAEPAGDALTEQPADPAATGALSDADAYVQLTASYDQLGGLDGQISQAAIDFNNNYQADNTTRQTYRDQAASIMDTVSAGAAELDGIVLAEGSAYTETLANLKTLYNDLSNRIRVLVEAWDAAIAGQDFSEILSADNGEGGVNIYKAEFDALYPNAQPQPTQA